MRISGNNLRIVINKHSVSYIDQGPDDAPVIIFIHGFPFNKSTWSRQLDALKGDYRVIAYDVRGHGNSDAGPVDFSINLFVNDLIEFMNALEIKRSVLCGLSMGGYIALKAVENFPDRFQAIVLCDTNCIADSAETREKRMKTIESIKKHGVEYYADESLKNLFAAESFTTRRDEIATIREIITDASLESLSQTLHAMAGRQETCSKLPGITVPVLIMVGKEDKLTPPSASQSMHEKVKGSVLRIIDQAGHLSNMENPADFNAQLLDFMASLKQTEPDKS